jgi:hypothetical protein
MFDDDLAQYKLVSVIDGKELSSDKRIKGNLATKINKAIHLQAMLNSIDSNEFTKDDFPYFPTNMTDFCKWEDSSIDLVKFGRTTFVNKEKIRGKILEHERIKVRDIVEKLMAMLVKAKTGTISLSQQVDRLRSQKLQLGMDKASLVSQLLDLQSLNKRLTIKNTSLYNLNDRLKKQLNQQLGTIHRIGEPS